MSTTATTTVPEHQSASERRMSAIIVSVCTLLGAAAQILIKTGMGHSMHNLVDVVTNLPLFCGYALYGVFTVMLVLALRKGELSMLYPIIALTYVWVTLLSYTLLHEPPSLYKNLGIGIIVIGVAVLGRGGKK